MVGGSPYKPTLNETRLRGFCRGTDIDQYMFRKHTPWFVQAHLGLGLGLLHVQVIWSTISMVHAEKRLSALVQLHDSKGTSWSICVLPTVALVISISRWQYWHWHRSIHIEETSPWYIQAHFGVGVGSITCTSKFLSSLSASQLPHGDCLLWPLTFAWSKCI